jgi:hypothetical protein
VNPYNRRKIAGCCTAIFIHIIIREALNNNPNGEKKDEEN